MAKELKCKRCNKYQGEFSKGKMHKDASILCDKCMKFYETCDSIAKCSIEKDKNEVGKETSGNFFGNFFGDMFDGKK